MSPRAEIPRANILGLHYFISKFLPGVLLLTGLFVLLPKKFEPSTRTTLIFFIVIFGYPAGQFLHSVSVKIDARLFSNSNELRLDHRTAFKGKLREKKEEESLFTIVFRNTYGIPLENLGCDDVYDILRSSVEIDSRGRSLQFQALLAFSRSMITVSFFLSVFGFLTWILTFYDAYTPIISGLMPLYVAFLSLLSLSIFWQAEEYYKKRYVRYLFVDFVNIHKMPSSTNLHQENNDAS